MPTPVSPDTGAQEIILAKSQKEYIPLPVAIYRDDDLGSPLYLSRWTLTDEERLAIAEGADIFVSQLTFGHLFRPIGVYIGPQHFQLPKEDGLEAVRSGHFRLSNPYQKDEAWWFYDEAEQEHGPYDTQEIAKGQLTLYCEYLEGNVEGNDPRIIKTRVEP